MYLISSGIDSKESYRICFCSKSVFHHCHTIFPIQETMLLTPYCRQNRICPRRGSLKTCLKARDKHSGLTLWILVSSMCISHSIANFNNQQPTMPIGSEIFSTWKTILYPIGTMITILIILTGLCTVKRMFRVFKKSSASNFLEKISQAQDAVAGPTCPCEANYTRTLHHCSGCAIHRTEYL